ncbi:HTH-type transcriptional repressor KstR2 [uncultured Eubacterium sp.]|nr:HTH-type transcriptional repressor KstR2 [uncultured Eubacterium sp.]
MKRNTRLEILQTAKALFNERGFNDVSTRDIANALGISKGNLSYYFKRKEDIVEAILEEFPGNPPDTPKTMAALNEFLLDMQDTVQENAFYFWHHAQLSQLSPKIKELQREMYRCNVQKLRNAFKRFQEEGYFLLEQVEGQYNRTIDALLLSSIYWLPFCTLKQEKLVENDFQKQAWSILFPLLTEKGRKQLDEIVGLRKQ